MKWMLAKLCGIAKAVLAFMLPLLKSKVADLLADARVQQLALAFVERAAATDLDGDGKHDHAADQLRLELKSLGIEYTKAAVSLAVEAAYQQWKAGQAK